MLLQETNRKKMKFSESNEEESVVETSGQKIVLFEEDASDDDFQPNFDVKENFTGINGYKVKLLFFLNT